MGGYDGILRDLVRVWSGEDDGDDIVHVVGSACAGGGESGWSGS